MARGNIINVGHKGRKKAGKIVKAKIDGTFDNTRKYLENVYKNFAMNNVLEKYGDKGAKELAKATPVDSGKTSESWGYEIVPKGKYRKTLAWTNDNVNDGASVAFLLAYGHAMPDGTYYKGEDYITPVLDPIIEDVGDAATKAVKNL